MVGDIIKVLRLEKGMTQKQLAQKVGTSESTIKMIETNKNNPGAELLPKLADALGVKPSDLTEKENKTESFTMELLEKLVKAGIIEDANDIKENELNLILYAIKKDIQRIKKDI
jgi:transcriptional regulator with XRE-family HTH domain